MGTRFDPSTLTMKAKPSAAYQVPLAASVDKPATAMKSSKATTLSSTTSNATSAAVRNLSKTEPQAVHGTKSAKRAKPKADIVSDEISIKVATVDASEDLAHEAPAKTKRGMENASLKERNKGGWEFE